MSDDLALYGRDMFGDAIADPVRGRLAQRFVVPPFSVLNAREGWWQERKTAWINLGIQSELGRGDNALGESEGVNQRTADGTGPYGKPIVAASPGTGGGGKGQSSGWKFRTPEGYRSIKELQEATEPEPAKNGNGLARSSGQDLMRGENPNFEGPKRGTAKGLTWGEVSEEFTVPANGTSIFDPVLCELAYRWFSGKEGQVVDPFAGGSVRGIVAGSLGRKYWGCDLRPEQIAANRKQASQIDTKHSPEWAVGDARDQLPAAPEADLLFSCPPYGDLERYSDDPRDLSTMTYQDFLEAYRTIIAQSCARLREHRFAVFVVGDFRCPKKGHYRGFVGDTVRAFEDCGLGLYNEAILLTAVGSLPIRAGKQFASGRKLGRTHQHMLVFVKGDWKQAAGACEDIL